MGAENEPNTSEVRTKDSLLCMDIRQTTLQHLVDSSRSAASERCCQVWSGYVLCKLDVLQVNRATLLMICCCCCCAENCPTKRNAMAGWTPKGWAPRFPCTHRPGQLWWRLNLHRLLSAEAHHCHAPRQHHPCPALHLPHNPGVSRVGVVALGSVRLQGAVDHLSISRAPTPQ